MAEAASVPSSTLVLRVAVRAPALAEIVRTLGHAISNSVDADVVLAESGADVSGGPPAVVLGGNETDAPGHLPADATPEQIDAALRAVAAGLMVRPRDAARFAAVEESDAPSPLSPRELEILIALADGLSNKQVARRFEISQHTVKFHIESIFRKLGVATRAEAVAKGLRRGLVHL